MSNTDPGEGSSLANDNYLAVYGGASILDIFYPVGSFYKTADLSFDPNVSWGGVWVEDTDFVLCAYVKTNSGATIMSSKNISSVVRNTTGQYTFTLTKPMEDTDGVICVSAETSNWGSEIVAAYWSSTSKIIADCTDYNGTHVDPSNWFLTVYGRLANPDYKIWRRTA